MTTVFEGLAGREAKFRASLTDSYGKTFKASTSSVITSAVKLTHPNDDWYYKEKTSKDKVVLHFTAGVLPGDIGELTKSKVSVSYVVARDGTVYELFNPDYWAYHLGPSAAGGNTVMSKSSIAIEISNFGPITDSGTGFLNTWSGKPYCAISQSEAYMHSQPFRGNAYFATFTDAQYASVKQILDTVCTQYSIPRGIPSPADRVKKFTSNPGKGIWSHQNFRADKSDVGPAFRWDKIA